MFSFREVVIDVNDLQQAACFDQANTQRAPPLAHTSLFACDV